MTLAEMTGLQRVVAVVALLGSLVVVWRFDRSRSRWGHRLRSRFVLGVPWGSAVAIGFVLAVYLFLQGGYWHWFRPVTLPYSAWSYFTPLGVAVAGLAHAGPGHLVGNLTSAAVLLPLAEYAFGHFPRERGSQSFSSWRTSPLLRAFVLFPAGVLFVALLTALFSWGPVIGFSGVVFAAAGFALVRYPIAAVVAVLGREVVSLIYRSLLDPVVQQEATSRFVRPGWAGIAVQGHALGLFLGAAAGVLVLYRMGSDERPSALRLWLGTVLAGMSLGLWALWWIRGGDTYVLFRAVGLAFVVAVALLVVAPVVASERPLLGRFGDDLTRRQVATVAFLFPLLVMSLIAVPVNLNVVEETGLPDDGQQVEVRDYTVGYAENVPDRMINVVDVSLFGETTEIRTSGVVVVSEQRNIWSREISPGQLAHSGRASVVVGGPGWREVVVATREGWSVTGGPTVYQVRLGKDGEPQRLAFESDPARADVVLAGHNVSLASRDGEFYVRLSKNGSVVERVSIPEAGESVMAGDVTFVRDGRSLIAEVDDTRVTVARKEQYD